MSVSHRLRTRWVAHQVLLAPGGAGAYEGTMCSRHKNLSKGAALVAIALTTSCTSTDTVKGSGKATKDTRDVPPFSQVSVSGAFSVSIDVGTPQAVSLAGDDNILPLVETRVDGERLVVSTRKSYECDLPVELQISVERLTALSVSGANMALVSGVSGDALEVSVSGAGRVSAQGTAKRLELDVSGIGKVDASKLESEVAEVSLSGAGKVQVHATKSLVADISGAGQVVYSGEPAEIRKNITGVGTLVSSAGGGG